MSYGIINPNEEQLQAWKLNSWDQLCTGEEGFGQLFSRRERQRLQERAAFSDQAMAMLASLNDFDRRKVIEEILALIRNPSCGEAKRHWRNPLNRFIKSRYPFGQYHFLINYLVEDDYRILVREIFYDDDLTGMKTPFANERPMMYNVQRLSGMKYERPINVAESGALRLAWEVGDPTSQVTTQHAAVNGMLNDLEKAGWLMGVHLDNAYRNVNPKEYTLFHNPTEEKWVDLVECLWDKSPLTSHNAKYLSAVLKQRQQAGQRTEWVVHSQGAIIFSAAVEHHNRSHRTLLNQHSVAVHAPGAHLKRMRSALERAGIAITRVRQNPFDLVPNLAGRNNLRASSLWRCLSFSNLVASDNGGNLGVSPHTLPYLGINTYQKQLEIAGFTKEAEAVRCYIEKRNYERQRRRGR